MASLTQTESSSIAVQADNPVVERLAVAAQYVLRSAAGANGKYSMGIKLGSKLIAEMMNDLKDSTMPPHIMEFYIKQLGGVIIWTATGEKDPDLPWPADLEV